MKKITAIFIAISISAIAMVCMAQEFEVDKELALDQLGYQLAAQLPVETEAGSEKQQGHGKSDHRMTQHACDGPLVAHGDGGESAVEETEEWTRQPAENKGDAEDDRLEKAEYAGRHPEHRVADP